MNLAKALRTQILSYLYGAIPLASLREKSASLTIAAGDLEDNGEPDTEALRLANTMIANFSDFDEGFISEPRLKQNLGNVLFSASLSQQYEIQNSEAAAYRIHTGTLSPATTERGLLGQAYTAHEAVYA
jgi:hypothetical protein